MNIITLIWLSIGFTSGALARYLFIKLSSNKLRKSHRNIDMRGRIIRFSLAIALFIWSYYSSWSATLLLFSGFCISESLFSWCGIMATLGRSSCKR